MAAQVWMQTLGPLEGNTCLSNNIKGMVSKWISLYLGHERKSISMIKIWNTNLQNTCWQIWLATNRAIFDGKNIEPQRVATKIHNMIYENMDNKQVSFKMS